MEIVGGLTLGTSEAIQTAFFITIIILQCAVIEGTYLALEYMSTKKGGKGGIVINTASIAGIY